MRSAMSQPCTSMLEFASARRVLAVALALLLAPLALLAQGQTPESAQASARSDSDSAQTADAGTRPRQPERPAIPLVPQKPTWDSFHGQLNAQKYSPLDQITADNVGHLEKVWEYHTGDISDGSGDTPATVWSATPIFANDTLYIGTPFYRVIALDPGTGKVKWSFDTQSSRKALTQPALKNRGVAYWEAEHPVAGEPCQKIVYMGTMDARLFALDADTGKLFISSSSRPLKTKSDDFSFGIRTSFPSISC